MTFDQKGAKMSTTQLTKDSKTFARYQSLPIQPRKLSRDNILN